MKNVIYLKNGRIIAGTLIEIVPDQYVKIISVENVSYTILYSDIQHIGYERMEYYSESTDTTVYAFGIRYSLFAGVAFPADEFREISHGGAGYAKPGSIFGGEINFPIIRSFFVNATVAVINNSVDAGSLRNIGIPNTISLKTENWNSRWFMPGLRWETKLENYALNLTLNYGWAYIESPTIFLSGNLTYFSSRSYSNTRTSFGFSVSGTALDYFTLSIRYFHSKPILPVTVMSNPEFIKSATGSQPLPDNIYYEQIYSLFSLTAGISF